MYKQKVKHMLYDHQNDLNALKIQMEEATKETVRKCSTQQDQLMEDKAALKQQLRQQVDCTYQHLYELQYDFKLIMPQYQ